MTNINLYESTEINFTHNGLIVLGDCKTAFVEEKLNDAYEVELEYPVDPRGKWQYLVEGNIIKASGQLFRIYHKEKTIAGIKVNARHIFYDLLDNFVEEAEIGNLNGAGALSAILSNTQYSHGFTSTSDVTGSQTYTIDKQNPVEAIMGEDGVISRYGGELERNNFIINLHQSRGLDRDVLISYGKNIVGIEETLDMDNVVTRLMPVGKDGLLLTAKYLDSSKINNYPHPIIKKVDFSDCETQNDLEEAGQAYLDQYDTPLANYVIDLIELTKTEEYKNYAILETCYMADTVTVRHTKLGIDIKAKVIRIKKNLLTNRIEEVELGSFRPNFAESINTSINTIVNQQVQDKSDLQAAIELATSLINSALGGYVVKRNGELLIMDTEDINTATNVWRWNINGLGYSSTGYNGPYALAMTMDGKIVADFITTGTLSAALIKTGVLTSFTGKITIALDDEILNIGNKIIYDGETDEVTFAETVALAWANISDAMGNKLTYIDGNGIYTGTLIAQQIYGLLLEAVTIKAGKILGSAGNPNILLFGDNGGSIDTTTDAGTGLQAMRMKPGMTSPAEYCGYPEVLENGEHYFYTNDGSGSPFAKLKLDGWYFGNSRIGAPDDVDIVYDAGGTGFTVTIDGVEEEWTWTKDGSGRITQLSGASGRTINVTY